MVKPQYAWKQEGKKSVWFWDKQMCLMHCKQRKTSTHPLYLYKRIVIPDGWVPFIRKTKYQEFRWKVKAFWGLMGRQDEGDWTLIDSPWYDNEKACLHHFKDMINGGYDVADCWGTRHYLVMRRRLVPRRTLTLPDTDDLMCGGGRDQEE